MKNTLGKPGTPPADFGHSGKPPLHLLTAFSNPNGGSENRTLELYSLLRPHGEVLLWSPHSPARGFSVYPIRTIHAFRGEFPLGGTLVIIGPHTEIGPWLKHAALSRIVVHANLYPFHYLFELLEKLDDLGVAEPEVVFASGLLQEAIGLPGRVEASPIDLAKFIPPEQQPERAFTVGRLSRDQTFKHHRDDPLLYQMLAAEGCAVRIMGGTILRQHIREIDAVELLPEGAVAAPQFLQQLDCFFYRTAEQWFEPSARVVFEAMACGLPVVCGRRGGYAEHIRHGVNGFLVESQEEAFDVVMQLKMNGALREKIGRAARAEVEQLYDQRYIRRLLKDYLGAGMPA